MSVTPKIDLFRFCCCEEKYLIFHQEEWFFSLLGYVFARNDYREDFFLRVREIRGIMFTRKICILGFAK